MEKEVKKSKKGRKVIAKMLHVAKILNDNGVNLRAVELSKTVDGHRIFTRISHIRQTGIDIDKIILDNGLDPNFNYGLKTRFIRNLCKYGTPDQVTEEEKKKFQELGVLEKEFAAEETLRVAKILHDNKLDIQKVPLHIVKNKKPQPIKLGEVKQEGIDMEKIISENNLDKDFKLGKRLNSIRQAYRGKITPALTPEERKLAEELKLVEPRQKNPRNK